MGTTHRLPRLAVAPVLFFLCWAGALQAEVTTVAIHVRANDAKLIGSSVGGLNVIVENAATGELLDSGRITGGTGDTAALMTEGQTRGHTPVAGAAGYRAELDIARPTRVLVRTSGPLAVADSTQTLSATTWVVPGKDMMDPGIVLRMPGLKVELARVQPDDARIAVEADVTMMCGCPITEGGLWDAADYEVVGQLYRDGEKVAEMPLSFTGERNRFGGQVERPESGRYELVVYAFQDGADNTGVVRRTLDLE